MKNFLVLSLLLIMAFATYAQKGTEQSKKPDIIFDEKSIDFGSVTDGETAKITFKFYNSGTAPLVLKSVKASCGCTASDWPKQPIMPGQSSTITASFNSNGYAGKNVTKSLTVTTNIKQANGNDKVILLNFKGNVSPKS